ncbi:MAG: cupin domain-containing protein [Desulfosudaceae bacterium]
MPDPVRSYTARDYVNAFDLQPHPEGGYFRETYRCGETIAGSALPDRFRDNRALCTSILFLLSAGEVSRFHRIKADEVWHFYCGCPLVLHLLEADGTYRQLCLGLDLAAGQRPQALVPHNTWFGASPLEREGFSLTGCTTAPGFEFEDFELADRETLRKRFPRHETIINRLTVSARVK